MAWSDAARAAAAEARRLHRQAVSGRSKSVYIEYMKNGLQNRRKLFAEYVREVRAGGHITGMSNKQVMQAAVKATRSRNLLRRKIK